MHRPVQTLGPAEAGALRVKTIMYHPASRNTRLRGAARAAGRILGGDCSPDRFAHSVPRIRRNGHPMQGLQTTMNHHHFDGFVAVSRHYFLSICDEVASCAFCARASPCPSTPHPCFAPPAYAYIYASSPRHPPTTARSVVASGRYYGALAWRLCTAPQRLRQSARRRPAPARWLLQRRNLDALTTNIAADSRPALPD